MAEIIRWPKHKQWVCSRDHEDDGWGCGFCSGSLFACSVCWGAEASLATECPGRRVTPHEERLILAQMLDFRAGRWVCEDLSKKVLAPPNDCA